MEEEQNLLKKKKRKIETIEEEDDENDDIRRIMNEKQVTLTPTATPIGHCDQGTQGKC